MTRPERSDAPRDRGEAAPRRGGFTPRPERPRSYVRRDGAQAPPGHGFTPRPGPGAARPALERPKFERPKFERPALERPKFERPKFERPREDRSRDDRAPLHDDGGDQTGAVNRSRPVYPQGPAVRWRRDGKPSQPTNAWTAPRTEDRRGDRQGGPAVRDDRAGGRGANGARDDRRSFPPVSSDGPSLPADPREAALRILHAVDTRSAFSDRLLDGAHARPGADPRDRALLHELVKGSLRWRGRLDAALDVRVHVGLANTQPWIRNILRLGAYQILFLDRVPMHAAVDESVKLAHKYAHPGAAGLVNSVLRRLAEERATITWPEGDDAASLAAWGSHPLWIVERWLARFGPADTRALLVADNRTVPTGLRANTLRNSREQLIELLAREGVEARAAELSPDLVWVEGHHSPGALHCFRAGLCTAQDESEALVGRVVAPKAHERVLDMCAAPGGKSTHLAELMGDDGEVWALERDPHRVETLRTTLERLGAHSVHVVHGDGCTYAFPMPFDRVLVDAPCSGMGVLARRADARWRKGPEVLAEMPPVQQDLLRAAALHLAPGGLLVYSVCSFEPEETDHVVARFLTEHPGWAVESVAGAVPDAVVTPEGFMCVLPHLHGCDGAFAVRLRKP
jgi:16S rRNA (cytosine967-C5)-methyltransferase